MFVHVHAFDQPQECCVPSIPRISEDLAVSRIGILQDMKIEQEQVELVQSYTSKKDLIGVAFVSSNDSMHSLQKLLTLPLFSTDVFSASINFKSTFTVIRLCLLPHSC